MEREFPKNVRQIGNVCDEPKIYVEDYVDTYLSQLRTKAAEAPAAAVLTGEIISQEGQAVVYVSGAIQLKEIEVNRTEIIISDDTKKDIEEKRKEYFPELEIVGWSLIEAGHSAGLSRSVNKIQGKMFTKENSIFIWKDALENEEIFFAYKYGELMQMGGHYIYYERNPAMQNYMISTRRQNGVTPSEMVEDRAAKDFRSTIRERSSYSKKHQSSGFLYVTSILLVIVVLVIGVSAMNNYDKMESVQNSLESLSQSVNQSEDDKEARQETAETSAEAEAEKEASAETTGEAAGEALGTYEGTDAGENAEVNAAEEAAVNMPDAEETMKQLSDDDYYIVKKGDTLDSISAEVYGDQSYVEAICKMNGLSDGNLIFIGQKILLP